MIVATTFVSVEFRVQMAADCLRNAGAFGRSEINAWTFARGHLRLAAKAAIEISHPETLRIVRNLRRIDDQIARLSPPEAA